MLCHFAKLLGRGCMWTVGGSVLVARGRAGTRGTVACGGGGGSWSRLAQLAQSLVHHPRCVCVCIYIYIRGVSSLIIWWRQMDLRRVGRCNVTTFRA
jgi:hypothetical protein